MTALWAKQESKSCVCCIFQGRHNHRTRTPYRARSNGKAAPAPMFEIARAWISLKSIARIYDNDVIIYFSPLVLGSDEPRLLIG
jgi:hypothetical protein